MMDEQNNTPQILTLEALTEQYIAHRSEKRRSFYHDFNGRLTWSCNEYHNNIYTWYVYDDKGDIIEMGDRRMFNGGIGYLSTIYCHTLAEISEYIDKCRENGGFNIRRLATPAEQLAAQLTLIAQEEPAVPQAVDTTVEQIIFLAKTQAVTENAPIATIKPIPVVIQMPSAPLALTLLPSTQLPLTPQPSVPLLLTPLPSAPLPLTSQPSVPQLPTLQPSTQPVTQQTSVAAPLPVAAPQQAGQPTAGLYYDDDPGYLLWLSARYPFIIPSSIERSFYETPVIPGACTASGYARLQDLFYETEVNSYHLQTAVHAGSHGSNGSGTIVCPQTRRFYSSNSPPVTLYSSATPALHQHYQNSCPY